jgi:hypothetical protein
MLTYRTVAVPAGPVKSVDFSTLFTLTGIHSGILGLTSLNSPDNFNMFKGDITDELFHIFITVLLKDLIYHIIYLP